MVREFLLCCGIAAGVGAFADTVSSPQAPAPVPAGLPQASAVAAAPVAYTVTDRSVEGAVELVSIEYAAPGAPSANRAWLVRPAAIPVLGGIAYFHYYGAGGSYSTYLSEAKTFAARGIISILPAGRVPWRQKWKGDANDADLARGQLADSTAALAILERELGADNLPIVVMGHDYGAMMGLVAAAADLRVKAVAALAFTSKYSDWRGYFTTRLSLKDADYDALMSPFDTLAAIRILSARPLFLQFAKDDRYVGEPDREPIVAAAGAAAAVEVVDVPGLTHENLWSLGSVTRVAWIAARLGLR